jgi:hypothetical protein
MAFFDLWIDLPRWVRFCIALSFAAFAIIFYFTEGVVWYWPWIVGGCLFVLSFPPSMKR